MTMGAVFRKTGWWLFSLRKLTQFRVSRRIRHLTYQLMIVSYPSTGLLTTPAPSGHGQTVEIDPMSNDSLWL